MINEPDTDFDLPQNQEWVEGIIKKWKVSKADKTEIIPVQIGDKTKITKDVHKYMDRCQDDEVCVVEMCKASVEDVLDIVSIAEKDPAGWKKTTLEERHKIMYKTANLLADMRGDLIGCMCAVTGKTILEGDVEVSEGIDYARFYTTTIKQFYSLSDVDITAKGTILVISPWNFPCAIPIGGIAAALAGGNTVILKPATVAAPVAWMFAKAFWDAGVPKEALQVIITDRDALKVLTTASAIKHIILTGGTDTAQSIAKTNPETPLSAETGGKNAMILTASGDRDHAIMNAVTSAFGNAGQKCSACSLFLVEKSVYEDKDFRSKLKDAATSLKVGSVWNPGNIVGPMITNKNDKLLKSLSLENHESWLVPPVFLDAKKYMLTPTIKLGVTPKNFSFRTELFGPMLSVVCIEDLKEGIDLVNSLEYGLTSGLQSLDEEEQKLWRDSIMAGNLYINRGITGAIVNRQPFGGMKHSAFGGGIKAGGPNYCACFVNITDKKDSQTDYKKSYENAYKDEFSKARDVNNLYGEQNMFRYLPLKDMALRLFPGDNIEYAKMIAYAAKLCKTPLTISFDPDDYISQAFSSLDCNMKPESLEDFIKSMKNYERIRTCSADIPKEMYEAAAGIDKYIATDQPVKNGRVELMHYIKEQSISFEYHRYGSISEMPTLE